MLGHDLMQFEIWLESYEYNEGESATLGLGVVYM